MLASQLPDLTAARVRVQLFPSKNNACREPPLSLFYCKSGPYLIEKQETIKREYIVRVKFLVK